MTLDAYIRSLKGKAVTVLGIGVSNTPLIELLAQNGVAVTAADKRAELGETGERLASLDVKLSLGESYLEKLDADVIFRTPGMHPNNIALQRARERGSVITSEMEAFFETCPCRIAAVTGSDGKTTTTTIIAELLRAGGYTVHLGGNIGKPLLCDVPGIKEGDFAVLELSSFQLHSMSCSPDIAVITNISPNHLDVHPDYEDYIEAKRSIFKNQSAGDLLVLNRDNAITRSFVGQGAAKTLFFSAAEELSNGVYLKDGVICSSRAGSASPIMPADEIRLPGAHNTENYMAAFCAVRELVNVGVMCSVAESFSGVRHRLELIRELNGIKYINDSIASSPTRTIAGLRAFKTKPILIAGGYDKRIPFDELGEEICGRAKALVITGDTAPKILAAVETAKSYSPGSPPIIAKEDFAAAVMAASALAVPGDTVLLSPACASFDQFSNFAERGDFFRALVLGMEG